MREPFVIVRGAGDIATGTIYCLYKCGFKVLALESKKPTAIRRLAAFCEAIYDGESTVEGVTAYRADGISDAERIMSEGGLPVMADEQAESIDMLKPDVVVDAMIAKRNLGTFKEMAPLTIGLGPGFTAGRDVHAAVETMRGHKLGRIIYDGSPMPNTGVPGVIAGFSSERVIHSPAEGQIKNISKIADIVTKGQEIAKIGNTAVYASIDGVLRGIIRDGYNVKKGMKIADIDPRIEQVNNCTTISDKARCIAGSVLEIIIERRELWE